MSSEVLEARVRTAPDDIDAWTVLADQLQEAGDPLGLLMALSLRGQEAEATDLRASTLGPAHALLADGVLEIEWRHGVPYRAKTTAAALSTLGAVSAVRFLRELELRDLEGDVASMLDGGSFDGLVRLDFNAFDETNRVRPKLGAHGAHALATCRRLAQLEHLSLGGQRIGGSGLEALLSADLGNLHTLELADNAIGPHGLVALASSETTPRLRALNLHNNRVQDEGIEALAGSQLLGQLSSLSLGMTSVANGLDSLARSPSLAAMESFVLYGDAPTRETMVSLVTSPFTTRLTSLVLASCAVGDDVLEALCRSPLIGRLVGLELQSNKITDRGVDVLVSVPTHLRRLNLEFNETTGAALEALAACPHVTTLEELWLWGDDEPALDTLLASPHLSDAIKRSLAYQFGRGPRAATE